MTKAKAMSEKEAWSRLAEFYDANPKEQFICNFLHFTWDVHRGALHIEHAGGFGDITITRPMIETTIAEKWPIAAMSARIDAHVENDGSYLTLDDPDTGRCFPRNDARVIFCLLMAIECKEN